jgi:hypothetical protein
MYIRGHCEPPNRGSWGRRLRTTSSRPRPKLRHTRRLHNATELDKRGIAFGIAAGGVPGKACCMACHVGKFIINAGAGPDDHSNHIMREAGDVSTWLGWIARGDQRRRRHARVHPLFDRSARAARGATHCLGETCLVQAKKWNMTTRRKSRGRSKESLVVRPHDGSL